MKIMYKSLHIYLVVLVTAFTCGFLVSKSLYHSSDSGIYVNENIDNGVLSLLMLEQLESGKNKQLKVSIINRILTNVSVLDTLRKSGKLTSNSSARIEVFFRRSAASLKRIDLLPVSETRKKAYNADSLLLLQEYLDVHE